MNTDMTQGLVARVQSQYAGLPPSEQRVAAYVLQNAEQVINFSVTQLADAVGVAEATVTRFCRSMGLRGYQELKMRLARDTAHGMSGPAPTSGEVNDLQPAGGVAMLARKLSALATQSIEANLQVLDLGAVAAAAEAICNARRIRFFGMGESWPLCYTAQMRLMSLNKTVDAHMDGHIQAMSAALLGPGDVAFGISHMGATKDVVESLSLARANGATTICLTAQGRSPITNVSDIRLICVTQDLALEGWTLRSKASQVLTLEVLVTLVALQMKEEGWKSAERAAEAVLDKLY